MDPHFFQLLDRIRYEAAVNAVCREARSLAVISTSRPLAEYYKEALLERLQAELPSASLQSFFPADTEVIIQAFNKVVSQMPLEQARAAPSQQQATKLWVVHDAAALPTSEVQTMLNLIEKFPGAQVRALLIFSGAQVAPEGLGAFEKSLMQWQIERPTLEQIKESMSRISDARSLVEVRDLVSRIAGNGVVATDNDLPAASDAMAGPAPESRPASADEPSLMEDRPPQKLALFKLTGVAAILLALSGGIAAWLNPETIKSWIPALQRVAHVDVHTDAAAPSAQTAGLTEAPRGITPTEALKEVPVELNAPPPEKASVPSSGQVAHEHAPDQKPATEADLIAEGQRWAAQLKRGTYVVQHAYHTSLSLAVEHYKRYPNLLRASVVPQYEPDRKLPRFALISGPFESKAAAEAFIKTESMPSGSWIRMSLGIQERLKPTLD